jgi:hypothetical protein
MKLNHPARQRTPSANSYLKLILDDAIIDALHDAAIAMERTATDISQEIVLSMPRGNEDGIEGKRNIKPPIRFKPMPRSYLHLTVFFGGEDLSALSSADLIKWHEYVSAQTRKIIASSSPYTELNDELGNLPQSVGENETQQVLLSLREQNRRVSLNLDSFMAFPPRRLNLLVAAFSAPSLLHQLHRNILTFSSSEGSALKSVALRNARGEWKPHVSLGRLIVDKKCVDKKSKIWTETLEKILDSGREEFKSKYSLSSAQDCMTQAAAYGVAMGGIIPAQVDLDWNMLF